MAQTNFKNVVTQQIQGFVRSYELTRANNYNQSALIGIKFHLQSRPASAGRLFCVWGQR
jgi:hypothetical protein